MGNLLLLAQESATTWLEIADRYGIPLVLLFLFIAGAFLLAKWAGRKLDWAGETLIKPALARHMQFIDKIESCITQNTASLSQLADLSESHQASLEQHGRSLDQQGQRIDQLAQALRASKVQS